MSSATPKPMQPVWTTTDIFLAILTVLTLGFLFPALWASRRGHSAWVLLAILLGSLAMYRTHTMWLAITWGAAMGIARGMAPKTPSMDAFTADTLPKVDDTILKSATVQPTWKFYLGKFTTAQNLTQQRDWMAGRLRGHWDSYQEFQELVDGISERASSTDAEVQLLNVDDCTLREARKGPRITQRTGTSGGRPYIGTKVGPALIGVSGKSKFESTSVTGPVEDILTDIDEGQVIVTTRTISFIGEKFTRNAKFSDIAAWHGEDSFIRIGARNRQNVWVAEFASQPSMWAVAAVLAASDDFDKRVLDQSSKQSAEEIKTAIDAAIKAHNEEFKRAYLEAYEQLEQSNDQLRLLHAQFPTKVADPGPRQVPQI